MYGFFVYSIFYSAIESHRSKEDKNDVDDDDDFNGDYADVLAPDYQIDRRQITMIESLGNGQFGEVYRGILKVNYWLALFFSRDEFEDSLYIIDRSTIRNKYSH